MMILIDQIYKFYKTLYLVIDFMYMLQFITFVKNLAWTRAKLISVKRKINS